MKVEFFKKIVTSEKDSMDLVFPLIFQDRGYQTIDEMEEKMANLENLDDEYEYIRFYKVDFVDDLDWDLRVPFISEMPLISVTMYADGRFCVEQNPDYILRFSEFPEKVNSGEIKIISKEEFDRLLNKALDSFKNSGK